MERKFIPAGHTSAAIQRRQGIKNSVTYYRVCTANWVIRMETAKELGSSRSESGLKRMPESTSYPVSLVVQFPIIIQCHPGRMWRPTKRLFRSCFDWISTSMQKVCTARDELELILENSIFGECKFCRFPSSFTSFAETPDGKGLLPENC